MPMIGVWRQSCKQRVRPGAKVERTGGVHNPIFQGTVAMVSPQPAPLGTAILGSGSGGRVLRGGGWLCDAFNVRVSLRYSSDPEGRGMVVGFRTARNAVP